MPEETGKAPEQITIVNGKPAECGCTLAFSDGSGQYSDVHRITLCETHRTKTSFGPTEVVRDENGYWYHPGIPAFDGGEDPEPYHAWLKAQGLQLTWGSLDIDLVDHPYWNGEANCIGWDPRSPGPEWFLLGIFDTEDGPHVHWARRVTP
jgi:hypothetical protein